MGRGLVAKKWLDMNYESLENFTSASGFLCWSAWNTEKHRDCQEHRFDTLFYKNFECFSLRKITQQSPYIAIYHNVWVLHRTKSFCINWAIRFLYSQRSTHSWEFPESKETVNLEELCIANISIPTNTLWKTSETDKLLGEKCVLSQALPLSSPDRCLAGARWAGQVKKPDLAFCCQQPHPSFPQPVPWC